MSSPGKLADGRPPEPAYLIINADDYEYLGSVIQIGKMMEKTLADDTDTQHQMLREDN